MSSAWVFSKDCERDPTIFLHLGILTFDGEDKEDPFPLNKD